MTKQNIIQLLSDALSKCRIAWAKMHKEYNHKDDTFRGAQVRERILSLCSEYIKYCPKWGVDINVLNTELSVKAKGKPVICKTGKPRLASGIVLANTQGRTLNEWWEEFQNKVPGTLAVCTDPANFQAVIIWTSDLKLSDIEDTGSQFKIKADSVYSERFTVIPVDPTDTQPQKGTSALLLDLEVLSYLDPTLIKTLETIRECSLQSVIKAQNENFSVPSNFLPMNVVQELPLTDLAEQVSSVRPCVNTV